MTAESMTITEQLTIERNAVVPHHAANDLTVSISEGRGGWLNVEVSGRFSNGTRRASYGFLPNGQQSRWSYSNRPPQPIVEAMKALRQAARVQAAAVAALGEAPGDDR